MGEENKDRMICEGHVNGMTYNGIPIKIYSPIKPAPPETWRPFCYPTDCKYCMSPSIECPYKDICSNGDINDK